MIDYGMSLPGAEKKEEYQHDWEREPVDAVLFTHYHGDHAGRFLEIPAQIRLYLGGASRQVMINIYQALTRARDQRTASSAREALSVLRNDARIRSFVIKPGTNPKSRRILCGSTDFWR